MGNNNLKGSLEFNWINKDKSLLYEIDEEESVGVKPVWVEKDDIRVSEPRNLKLVKEFGDPNNENMLIKGDNLLALRSLVEEFKNRDEKDKVKCIYIDPPFNIGSGFEYYDDNLEHSQWLTMMRDRLILLKHLLRADGVICVHIDDAESHYLKILMDEIFGRRNFISVIYVQTVYPDKTLKQDRVFHDLMEQVLLYKNTPFCKINQEYVKYDFEKFCWYITETGGSWKTTQLGGKRVDIFREGTWEIKEGSPSKSGLKEIWASGTILDINSSGRFFRDYLMGRVKKDGLGILYKVYGIGEGNLPYRYFTGPKREGATKGKYYQGVPKDLLTNSLNQSKKISIENFWDLAAQFGNCRHEGGVELKSGKKPEILIMRLLKYFSSEGDLVLDSFLGSGTTVAVAHKMHRRWIGIEIGKHAETLCIPRLKRVISGADQTGTSKEVGWKGGGGFRYYVVGDSLIRNSDINWDLTYEEIARALFRMFDYSFVGKLEDEIYLGRRKVKYALSIASKSLDIIKNKNMGKIIEIVKEKCKNMTELEIYTNKGVGIKEEDLPEGVSIKKIPESVLRKYKL
jgi:adenine-specific DNA-methyltransferase